MATAAVEIPSSNHGVPGSHLPVHAKYPEAPPRPLEPVDPRRVASQWVDTFNNLLDGQGDADRELFLEDSYWRDLLCSSWDFHTFQGLAKISSVLKTRDTRPRLMKLVIDANSKAREPVLSPIDFKGSIRGIQAFLTVETDIGRGRGMVKLVQDVKHGGKWKAFTLFTTLEELKGYEESIWSRRPSGVEHGAHPGRLNWQQRRDAEANCEGSFEPTVLVLGMYTLNNPDFYSLLTKPRCGTGRSGSSCSIEAAWRTSTYH